MTDTGTTLHSGRPTTLNQTRTKVIWQMATSLFYHIRQVAALNEKLLVGGAFATLILGTGGSRGQRCYHSKERWWFISI